MLLETVDVKRNDVLIFSNNVFDLNENFRIVFKKDKIKRPYKINFEEVCDFISEPIPKNIIVYRLLTNISSLDVFKTKFGYFIKTQNGMELIYFDPVYAIKDLVNLNINLSDKGFRFKIQQVGFTSLTGKFLNSDYTEIFSWDMRAKEAQNQNDKVFADALFIFDENYINDGKDLSVGERDRINKEIDLRFSGINIKEEVQQKSIDFTIKKPVVNTSQETNDIKEIKKQLLKQALGIKSEQIEKKGQKSFSTFLDRYRNEAVIDESNEFDGGLTGYFKENANKTLREESVILRFTSEK
ncbi:MAG TPA: hypothetical protein PL041_06620 [Melioribacteraceae bacterium]|nr:hypothetical protein [Melioribacteraceae bacterium]